MNASKKELGKRGEDLAVDFLKNNKYKILERNYKSKFGEIDIIAKDGKVICFVEVKSRKSDSYGSGFDAVNYIKKDRIIKTAFCFLNDNDLSDVSARFDVISIEIDPKDDVSIDIIKNAFEID